MKSKVISIALSVAALALLSPSSIPAAEPTGPNAAVEKLILQLEADWANALVNADQVVLDRIVASDWMFTDPAGHLFTKAQVVADLKSGTMDFVSFHNDDLQVRVYGDTAIVYGLETEKSSYQGKDISGQYRFTDVFVKRDGRWWAVATHGSRVTKE
jgi:ketosteroid isomerase-like protein